MSEYQISLWIILALMLAWAVSGYMLVFSGLSRNRLRDARHLIRWARMHQLRLEGRCWAHYYFIDLNPQARTYQRMFRVSMFASPQQFEDAFITFKYDHKEDEDEQKEA